jgi:hypothetical protein
MENAMEAKRASTVASCEKAVRIPGFSFVVVITGGAFGTETFPELGLVFNFVNPELLTFRSGFNSGATLISNLRN